MDNLKELEIEKEALKLNIGDCFMLADEGELSYIQVIELPFKALVVDNEPSINILILDASDFYRYDPCSKQAFVKFYDKISKRLSSKIK